MEPLTTSQAELENYIREQFEKENGLYHLWVSPETHDVFNPNIFEHILCTKMGAEKTDNAVGVTIDPNQVDCLKCLEWMHA